MMSNDHFSSLLSRRQLYRSTLNDQQFSVLAFLARLKSLLNAHPNSSPLSASPTILDCSSPNAFKCVSCWPCITPSRFACVSPCRTRYTRATTRVLGLAIFLLRRQSCPCSSVICFSMEPADRLGFNWLKVRWKRKMQMLFNRLVT